MLRDLAMVDEALGSGHIDIHRKEALKRFQIGGRGITILTQKGRAGSDFKFRPVHYDPIKDLIILHNTQITQKVKRQRVPPTPLLRYLVHFGIGMAAEMRRMGTSGICPMFNHIDSDTNRKWYKTHWTRLEKEANEFSFQLIEFNVDSFLHKVKIGNPIPVNEHTSFLKKLRKEDVSRFQQEIQDNLLEYMARSMFSTDAVAGSIKEKERLERYARTAAGPKRWFYIERALKKLKFGQPSSYEVAYPAVAEAIYTDVKVEPNSCGIDGLPEREAMPKVWKAKKCIYFDWRIKENDS